MAKAPRPLEPVRLNKYISECGVASRRHADELINEGAVQVNGKKVYELGTKVDPAVDRITVNGKPVKPPTQKVYIMFNKPKNVVTTMSDPLDRPTIKDYFGRLPIRVFPVGRLDWDSEGMILLTNDGDFAQKVNHPSKDILKTYLVKIDGRPSTEQLEKLKFGVSIVGGRVSAKHIERVRRGDSDKYDWILIKIAEGKNRQIRQMFEKIGFDVMKLQRVAIGRLRMPGSLKRGEFVFLTEAGVSKIFEIDPSPAERAKLRQTSTKSEARMESSRKSGPGKKPSGPRGGKGSRPRPNGPRSNRG